ncbi:MAG: uroporphyrinogen decarboxylase family protein [Candidatus Latescibacteria bacterium]|nr:uroporphyrinogen decarboxylase family protein [Candidatus Latescibacterota bacterium]
MDSRERYVRALTFDGPDRVPIMHHAVPGAFRAHGPALEELYERYPSDVLLSPVTHNPFSFQDHPRGHWANGAVSHDDWGCGWHWTTPDHMGIAVEHPLEDWGAVATFRAPDPMVGDSGVRHMEETAGPDRGRHFVFADAGEVFQRMFFLRGYENLLLDLLEDRPEVYALRDIVVDHCLTRINRWHETGLIDGLILRDDWGSQQSLLVNPRIWRRVFKPAYARILEAIHAGGAYASFHSDGAIQEIVPDLVEMGWEELNPQVHVMDIEELGRLFGGKVCVRADIDRQWTLPQGAPEDVRNLVTRLYGAFGSSRGGYVAWGEMNADVPLGNCEALLETASGLHLQVTDESGQAR